MPTLTQWKRAPDKVARHRGLPIMLWLKPGDLRAICGEVEIEVFHSRHGEYRAPIRGRSSRGDYGYHGHTWEEEPTPQDFESYALNCLETLDREGRL
ncbi:MAG TPA: hypothetical protein VMI31_02640 [Fimbriimonadaceae bacterium]|nr:hypothetical protein [Fimbriimonadaceae bacterium]